MNHEVKIKIVASVYKTFSFPRALSPTIRRRYVYAHARIAVASSNYIHSCRGSTHVAYAVFIRVSCIIACMRVRVWCVVCVWRACAQAHTRNILSSVCYPEGKHLLKFEYLK